MPPLSWADLGGRRVGLWGLGVEGRASRARLEYDGNPPAVLVDDRPAPGVTPTDEGGLDALAGCDLVIKTPGISRYLPAVAELERAGVAVVGGLGLWLAGVDRDRVACITGTKGKSTTTALATHLARGLGADARAAGNIGSPPWAPSQDAPPELWLVEVSSYQALDLAVAPRVVAVTSLSQDHLTWHAGDAETYYRDKLSICRLPGAELTIANGDSPLIRSHAQLLGPRVEWIGAADPAGPWADALGLLGAHNRGNALLARAILRALGVAGADDDEALLRAAGEFAGLESRLRMLGNVGGVDFVDDSLSTNVLPTLAAVDAFPGRRVALLVGGEDRGIDYTPLAVGLGQREAPIWVATMPDSGPRIGAVLRAAGVAAVDLPDLGSAVAAAAEWAAPDGVVLLSPAAPSFGQFADYRARASAFAGEMRRLGVVSAP